MRLWMIQTWDRKGNELTYYEFRSSIPFWLFKFLTRFIVPNVSWYSEIKHMTLSSQYGSVIYEIDLYRHKNYKK